MDLRSLPNHKPEIIQVAGIHLSGLNTNKTSVVVLEIKHNQQNNNHLLKQNLKSLNIQLKIHSIYSKIGSNQKVFSDDRILEVLTHLNNLNEIFVDCPISVPPCISCTRPSCPGVKSCEDLSVAYMYSLSKSLRSKGRKHKIINPQSQRLWDIVNQNPSNTLHQEPTYSSNAAPLVHRARTLQKRLNAEGFSLNLQETSVAMTLQKLAPILGLEMGLWAKYKNFEQGKKIRKQILEKLTSTFGSERFSLDDLDTLQNLECFQAFVCAFVGTLFTMGYCTEKPPDFLPSEGWVYLPRIEEDAHIDKTLITPELHS